ncbi:hypothetical protein DL96DRAFT_1584179 [Flagelloscypha sp. PMI_526]|nr:hypothetical protein DL96DRAFT_1584179 [Flagelloscypha sp. PMI_526]
MVLPLFEHYRRLSAILGFFLVFNKRICDPIVKILLRSSLPQSSTNNAKFNSIVPALGNHTRQNSFLQGLWSKAVHYKFIST